MLERQQNIQQLIEDRAQLKEALKNATDGVSLQSVMFNPSKALKAVPIVGQLLENNELMISDLNERIIHLEALDHGK
ncbi:hypothetical protein [Aliivibrio kagoshimensis]|uniref:hypothetical protein n=1 Tax=Aliivibrio kagoshimensis TaxID=2910230 RepID=UPI003D116B7D